MLIAAIGIPKVDFTVRSLSELTIIQWTAFDIAMEVKRLMDEISGTNQLMALLLYGCGLRLMEYIRLRVMDVDFDNHLIVVRDGKGNKDRSTLFPDRLQTLLRKHLEKVEAIHQQDLADGYDEVYLPYALSRKLSGAAKSWKWQYIFPSSKLSKDPRSNGIQRHHIDETTLQKAVSSAGKRLNIHKRFSCHTLRHYVFFRIMSSDVGCYSS